MESYINLNEQPIKNHLLYSIGMGLSAFGYLLLSIKMDGIGTFRIFYAIAAILFLLQAMSLLFQKKMLVEYIGKSYFEISDQHIAFKSGPLSSTQKIFLDDINKIIIKLYKIEFHFNDDTIKTYNIENQKDEHRLFIKDQIKQLQDSIHLS